MRVAIDPGHGGSNIGCVYPGLTEKHYTLELAYLLRQALLGAGHPTALTRLDDDNRLFTERAWTALGHKADICLSLHVNANVDPKATGMRAYYMPGIGEAKRLAALTLKHAPGPLRPRFFVRSPIKASLDGLGDDAVLRRYLMPAALVEVGFASNPQDLTYLLSSEGKAAIVAGLVVAVGAYEQKAA